MSLQACPHCSVSLRGERIPQEYVDKGYYGPPTDEPKYYMRQIGHEIRGVYDGVLYWACPDCGGTWQRWAEGSRQFAAAEKYMHGPVAA